MFVGKVVYVECLFFVGPFFYGSFEGLPMAKELLVYAWAPWWSFLS